MIKKTSLAKERLDIHRETALTCCELVVQHEEGSLAHERSTWSQGRSVRYKPTPVKTPRTGGVPGDDSSDLYRAEYHSPTLHTCGNPLSRVVLRAIS